MAQVLLNGAFCELDGPASKEPDTSVQQPYAATGAQAGPTEFLALLGLKHVPN